MFFFDQEFPYSKSDKFTAKDILSVMNSCHIVASRGTTIFSFEKRKCKICLQIRLTVDVFSSLATCQRGKRLGG